MGEHLIKPLRRKMREGQKELAFLERMARELVDLRRGELIIVDENRRDLLHRIHIGNYNSVINYDELRIRLDNYVQFLISKNNKIFRRQNSEECLRESKLIDSFIIGPEYAEGDLRESYPQVNKYIEIIRGNKVHKVLERYGSSIEEYAQLISK